MRKVAVGCCSVDMWIIKQRNVWNLNKCISIQLFVIKYGKELNLLYILKSFSTSSHVQHWETWQLLLQGNINNHVPLKVTKQGRTQCSVKMKEFFSLFSQIPQEMCYSRLSQVEMNLTCTNRHFQLDKSLKYHFGLKSQNYWQCNPFGSQCLSLYLKKMWACHHFILLNWNSSAS